MKITFETNLTVKNRKVLSGIFIVIILLSAFTVYLVADNRGLSLRLQESEAGYNALSGAYASLQSNYTKLVDSRDQLYDMLNRTVTLERKYWNVIEENITLRPKDTLTVTIRLDNRAEYMGIDGIDRIELTWVGIYSPNLTSRQMRTAMVDQYIGPNDFTERWIGEKAIAFGSYQDTTVVRHVISPNETAVRESVTSTTFFFENYNYLGYTRPGNSITIKLFYDGNVCLTIRELEFYVVGFITIKLGDAEDFKSGWVGNNIEYKIRHYGEMP